MAGIGIDAVIMQGANPDLKKAVGSAAYFVSAARYANHPPVHLTVKVDDHPPLRRRAHLVLVGNVGLLSGNIPMIPDARADDGLLDVLVASPRSLRDWVRLIARVLTRRRRPDEQLTRLQGQRVTLTVEEPDHYQLDGDTVGSCTTMTAQVHQSALLIRVPTGTFDGVQAPPALVAADAEADPIRPIASASGTGSSEVSTFRQSDCGDPGGVAGPRPVGPRSRPARPRWPWPVRSPAC